MTSVNYNVAATTALRTLQQTNKALEETQNRVSTGLKIGEAKDNAAYWSISTTLKSDNKALDTVKDALSLGAATVDTAYQGLNKALEVLNDIKSKVTAAAQNGVDKQALQSEIQELQKQLSAIATSSSFSGENWLSVNSSVTGFNPDKSVVSSFSRDSNNNVTLSSIQIDTRSFVLVDGSSTNEGILDAGKSGNLTNTGGFTTALSSTQTAAVAAAPGTQSVRAAGTFVGTTAVSGFDIQIGTAGAQTISFTPASASAADYTTAVNAALAAATPPVPVTFAITGGNMTFTANAVGADPITIANLTGAAAASGLSTAGASTPGTAATVAVPYAAATVTSGATFATFTLDSNDTIKFDLSVNGKATTVKVDRETIAQALNTTAGAAGTVTTVSDYATVLSQALKNANISGVTVSATATNVVFTGATDTTSLATTVAVASNGQSILEMDVTTATSADLKAYLENISTAADKVTSGAALLGAVSSRVELQQTFVASLVDTIDKGVSGLIDADLSEESTRLQALQTKQQLGIQALSIANASTQNVLSLFQN
jgi:flagellin